MYTDTNAKRAPWTDVNSIFMGDNQTTAWISRTF
jgi:hypothetical protein